MLAPLLWLLTEQPAPAAVMTMTIMKCMAHGFSRRSRMISPFSPKEIIKVTLKIGQNI